MVPVEKISLYELPEEKLSNKVSRQTAVGKNMSVAKYLLKKIFGHAHVLTRRGLARDLVTQLFFWQFVQ